MSCFLPMKIVQSRGNLQGMVALAETQGCVLDQLEMFAMQSIEPGITEDVFSVLTPEASADSRTSLGGTALERVREAAAAARERFL